VGERAARASLTLASMITWRKGTVSIAKGETVNATRCGRQKHNSAQLKAAEWERQQSCESVIVIAPRGVGACSPKKLYAVSPNSLSLSLSLSFSLAPTYLGGKGRGGLGHVAQAVGGVEGSRGLAEGQLQGAARRARGGGGFRR